LKLSQAYETFVLYKRASGVSDNTISNYQKTWQKVRLYFHADPAFEGITLEDWLRFMAWVPDEFNLAPKSVANIHTDLSSLYTWATDMNVVKEHLFRRIPRPRFEKPDIEPFTQDQVAAMLKACDVTNPWTGREGIRSNRHTADRDRAIILVLLSTGMRASELCGICKRDLDLGNNKIDVAGKGKGRSSKQRSVYIGKRTAKALWRYLTPRLSDMLPTDPIFTVGPEDEERAFSRNVLSRLVSRIGERAGIEKAHPHRFRHTFAINYLRNGGDVLTLQRLLGHESLEMVRRYANVAAADCAAAHKTADPVDNWRL
jgi:site-specific recombinase XerD